jgi:hypothetical protein
MNNIHQMHIGAMVYANDYNGSAPYQWPQKCWNCGKLWTGVNCGCGRNSGWDESLETECCQHVTSCGSATGWKVFDAGGYISRGVMQCPSQLNAPLFDSGGQFGIHYSYRYNSRRVIAMRDDTVTPSGDWCHSDVRMPQSGLLQKPERARMALFADRCMGGRQDGGGFPIILKDTDYYKRRWAHEEGGHICSQNGSVIWLPNVAPTPGSEAYVPGWPMSWYTWYGCGWSTNRWGPGLDDYIKNK